MKTFLYLITIYLVWGSTYLAMRIGVMPGSGFPPFALGAARLLVAGPILLLFSKMRGHKIFVSKRDLFDAAVAGLLMWLAGHGLILWSEQYVDSGYAALVIGSSPIWVMLIGSFLDRKFPRLISMFFILLGFVGVTLLVLPKMNSGSSNNILSTILILLGTIGWGAGSIYQQRRETKRISSFTRSGYQQFFAGIGFLITSLCLGEPRPHPTASAWLAWAYLLVFGSLIAFTVYVKALKELRIQVVMTHAYVNPVIAVILGALVLSEKIETVAIFGGILIVASVLGVIMEKRPKELKEMRP
jgi:drug/metabolite transporter (DMT)-like permease